MICCNCKKEIKRSYATDPGLNGNYCRSCAAELDRVAKLTPEEAEAFLMTNWRGFTRELWEVDISGNDNV